MECWASLPLININKDGWALQVLTSVSTEHSVWEVKAVTKMAGSDRAFMEDALCALLSGAFGALFRRVTNKVFKTSMVLINGLNKWRNYEYIGLKGKYRPSSRSSWQTGTKNGQTCNVISHKFFFWRSVLKLCLSVSWHHLGPLDNS